jgi:hypothetical protein
MFGMHDSTFLLNPAEQTRAAVSATLTSIHMTLGMSLVICAGICLLALALNSVENFFLRRSIKRHLKAVDTAPAADPHRAVSDLQRIMHLARYAQQRPSWRGPEIVQLGRILADKCSRKLDALLR